MSDGKQLRIALLVIIAMCWPVTSAWCVSWPVEQDAVRKAISGFLRTQGWDDLPQAARLLLPEPLSTKERQPQLQVTSLEWDYRQQALQFRLRCLHASCLDFLVHVVLPRTATGEWQSRLLSLTGLPGSDRTGAENAPLLVQRGKPATLVVQEGTMRLFIPVVCAEPGILKQRIRVYDKLSHRVLYGEVIGADLLGGDL